MYGFKSNDERGLRITKTETARRIVSNSSLKTMQAELTETSVLFPPNLSSLGGVAGGSAKEFPRERPPSRFPGFLSQTL